MEKRFGLPQQPSSEEPSLDDYIATLTSEEREQLELAEQELHARLSPQPHESTFTLDDYINTLSPEERQQLGEAEDALERFLDERLSKGIGSQAIQMAKENKTAPWDESPITPLPEE